jgi:hypothetical protein
VDNLLVGDDAIDLHKGSAVPVARRDPMHGGDDDDNLGGIGDDFEIPCTAQTNEPFFTQVGTEYGSQQVHDGMMMMMDDGGPMLMPQPEMNDDELNKLRFDGDNLIAAPMQVNALNIEYAKYAKHIDVRRLKQLIWNLLCNEASDNDKVSYCGF